MRYTFFSTTLRSLVAFIAVLVVATACSATANTADGDDAERNVRSAAIDEDLLDEATTEPASPDAADPTVPPVSSAPRVGTDLTPEEEQCFADSGFTFADLATAVTDTGASGGEAQERVLRLTFECAPGLVLSDGWLAEFGPNYFLGSGITPSIEETRCIVQAAIDSGRPAEMLLATDENASFDAVFSCLSPESQAIAEGTAGPANVGDDPEADQLYDLCLRGSLEACDLLYWRVALEGEYFDVAFDCGGAPAGSDFWCVEGLVDADSDGLIDDGSPGLEPLAERCRGGDMASCDMLFLSTEFGSDYERIGETCGERVAIAPAAGCIGEFGVTASE